MKKIRCLTNISAVKINDQIINFDNFPSTDKIVEVADDIAEILLQKEGYEEVKERVERKLEEVSKKAFSSLWDKLKKSLGGK